MNSGISKICLFQFIKIKFSQYEMNNFVKWSIFRFVMSSLNISGRRIIDMETVEEMIKAVDDGDGQLEYDEFIQLLKKWKQCCWKISECIFVSWTTCEDSALVFIRYNNDITYLIHQTRMELIILYINQIIIHPNE